MNVVNFHNPMEENGYLSNWYLSKFNVNGFTYSSVEQYMMYQKAVLFGDDKVAENILKTDNVSDIKAFGRAVKNYNDVVWNGLRQLIVFDGLYAKFAQNEELKAKLIGTGDDILAECAVHDRIWGIGLSMSDERRDSLHKWNGQNLLGFSLMRVREKLKSDNK